METIKTTVEAVGMHKTAHRVVLFGDTQIIVHIYKNLLISKAFNHFRAKSL